MCSHRDPMYYAYSRLGIGPPPKPDARVWRYRPTQDKPQTFWPLIMPSATAPWNPAAFNKPTEIISRAVTISGQDDKSTLKPDTDGRHSQWKYRSCSTPIVGKDLSQWQLSANTAILQAAGKLVEEKQAELAELFQMPASDVTIDFMMNLICPKGYANFKMNEDETTVEMLGRNGKNKPYHVGHVFTHDLITVKTLTFVLKCWRSAKYGNGISIIVNHAILDGLV